MTSPQVTLTLKPSLKHFGPPLKVLTRTSSIPKETHIFFTVAGNDYTNYITRLHVRYFILFLYSLQIIYFKKITDQSLIQSWYCWMDELSDRQTDRQTD